MGVVIRRWVWLETIGVVSGCFPHITCISLLHLYLFFFAAVYNQGIPLVFCPLTIHGPVLYCPTSLIRLRLCIAWAPRDQVDIQYI